MSRPDPRCVAVVLFAVLFASGLVCCDVADDDDAHDGPPGWSDATGPASAAIPATPAGEAASLARSYPITGVEVEPYNTYVLANALFPTFTGDLWPCAWGKDDRLYAANGDGFGFGAVPSDIVFNFVEGDPPDLTGSAVPGAFGPFIAQRWGPDENLVSRKPTGLICVDGAIYLFFQNLANARSGVPFQYATNGSVSVTRDGGLTWEWDTSGPMFSDYVFTTGFFLDYGRCSEHAPDEYVYVYGLDYNWRWADGFDQTRMFLARVPQGRILEREAWEFYAGSYEGEPYWTLDIECRVAVLEDDTLYRNDRSGIGQGSVVYLAPLNRYLYSTRAQYEWIFYEAPRPWGPWTKIAVIEWTGGWREDFHPGYPTVVPSKYLDADGCGGWVVSSMSSGFLDGAFYVMGLRRFGLSVGEQEWLSP